MTTPLNPTDEHDLDLTPDEVAAAEREYANRHLEPGGFVKLYGSLARSGIWTEGTPARKQVWLALLLAADADGCVDMDRADLAASIGGVTVDEAEAALEYLASAGRIEFGADGPIRIPNHRRYREMTPPTGDTTHGTAQKGTREKGGSE